MVCHHKNQKKAEPNAETFSQHLDKPLNKTEMEALQDQVDHGTKLQKKAGKITAAARNMGGA